MAWLLPLALAVIVVLTSTAFRRRSIVKSFSDEIEATDRFVDIGVTMRVVRADESGEVLVKDGRKMVVVRTYHFGGIVDTKAAVPYILDGAAGISQNPQQWLCSEDQEPIILHSDSAPVGRLALGGMGAGKTTAGVMWLYLRWLENLGLRKEGGVTAPTETRLSLVFNELLRMFPASWFRYNAENKIITLCDGFRIRGVSTHRQSASQGSRLQGFNWLFWLGDELQDQTREFVDIQARLRAKADGRAKRLATATAKDAPEWRSLKGSSLIDPDWATSLLLGPNSPFVHPDHWERMKRATSEREYQRLVLAEDLPPETATYPEWSRSRNLIAVPSLGWSDVTRHELRSNGPNYTMLVGHDPGTTMDVSLFLRAYVRTRDEQNYHAGRVKPFWVVLGELNTDHSTTEFHIKKLLERVRSDDWQLNLTDRQGRVTAETNQILVNADPASNSDQRTDKSVYTQFANAQIRARPAAWNKTHDGHGRVPREPAVEMVNTLFRNAAQECRLFVAKDERNLPLAPKLVEAIESAERDIAGRAEVHLTKGRNHDMTHWPAALRYALWPIERPRLQMRES